MTLLATLGHLGRLEDAEEIKDKLRRIAPRFLTVNIRQVQALMRGYEAMGDFIEEGLRKVGLPEV